MAAPLHPLLLQRRMKCTRQFWTRQCPRHRPRCLSRLTPRRKNVATLAHHRRTEHHLCDVSGAQIRRQSPCPRGGTRALSHCISLQRVQLTRRRNLGPAPRTATVHLLRPLLCKSITALPLVEYVRYLLAFSCRLDFALLTFIPVSPWTKILRTSILLRHSSPYRSMMRQHPRVPAKWDRQHLSQMSASYPARRIAR